ncbi:MAG: DUF3105 domain-containing protein [bacterium]|nr:DUF3105 domain-containing protein [bacterium]
MSNGELLSEREERMARARRARLVKRIFWILAAIVIIGGAGYGLVRYSRQRSQNMPGAAVPGQGQQHVALGTPFEYNSNPPTSGPHFATPSEWGVYSEEIHDQILIHNLEHGGIWISYKPGIDPGVIAKLEAMTKEFGRKVIMTPRQANDADVALAAWGRLDKFSAVEFSDERVREFIQAWRNKGPEFVP